MKKNIPFYITTLTILTVVAGVLFYGYMYFYTELTAISNEQNVQQTKAQSAEAILARENEYAKKLAGYFVKEGDEASFLGKVERYCNQIDLACSIQSLDETAEESGRTKLLHVSIAADGSLEKQNELISHLESFEYPLTITEVSINSIKTITASSTTQTWKGAYSVNAPVLIGQQ